MNSINLFFWFKTAVLFLLRSGRSTALLFIMVMTAVAVLVFLSSLAVGVNDAMVKNSVQLYSGHISGFNLPDSLKQEDLLKSGVTGVLRRELSAGALSNGRRIETVMLALIDPHAERKYSALWKKMISGEYPASGERAVFISHVVAERLGLSVGDEVSFISEFANAPSRLAVSGIFKAGVSQFDRLAFAPYGAVPINPAKWQAAVFLEDGAEPSAIIAVYNAFLPGKLDFRSWGEIMPDLRQLIELNYVSMSMVIVLVFGVVAVGIAAAFSIFIFKHLREYAVMKAMGVMPVEMTLLIVAEISIMSISAVVAGAAIGVIAVFIATATGIDLTAFTSHNQYFAVSGVIIPRLTFYSLLAPPAVCFIFSALSAIWPAMLVRRARAADILRAV
ncbi:ABC transporter permease [bacterium]|nr:MAG: ABC transporter permease [bacterium]